MKVDLLDPDLYAGDPGPTYAWLRANAPVYRDEQNAIWGISCYDDVAEVERNAALYSSASGSRPKIASSQSMINKDDPEHQAQRHIVYRRFTPRAVSHHEDRVRVHVTTLLDAVASRGGCEVVQDLAAPLPAMVICEQIGWDLGEWPMCKRVSEVTMAGAGHKPGTRDYAPMIDAVGEFNAAAAPLIAARRSEPRDDLVSMWIASELEDAEIVQEMLLVLDGGAETTRSVIGSTVLALIEHPDERQKLLDDPSLIGRTAVEEFIRWVTPILNMRRTATRDHSLHGEDITAGDELLLMYGSANRDERVFAEPDVFDVTRAHNNHIAFGLGTHFCLGASLARLEIRVLFEELLRRLPSFRLAPGADPKVVPGFFARTLESLHVEF